jgi:protein-S-isoprenylcysteine O-methyltransferase Ste14
MVAKKSFPPTYLLVSILVMLCLGFLFPIPRVISPFWNLLGLLPLALGILFNMSADRAFQQVHTTTKPFAQSSTLVTEGVYQISRNPMYLGFALILVGIAILLRSLLPYLVIVLFMLLIDKVFIRVEEKILADQFGDQWETDRKKIRRWI